MNKFIASIAISAAATLSMAAPALAQGPCPQAPKPKPAVHHAPKPHKPPKVTVKVTVPADEAPTPDEQPRTLPQEPLGTEIGDSVTYEQPAEPVVVEEAAPAAPIKTSSNRLPFTG